MAVTTDPNAVFYSYQGVGTNQAVKKFIDLLDEKGIPHRGSESEPIDGSLTAFEEKIGAANIIVIFYSQAYFESEHCMNEYANIRKYENEARKAATYFVKCDDYDINKLVKYWGGQKATIENKQFALTDIEHRSLANGYYLDKTTLYCVQNLDNYFSPKVRYKEDSLQTLVDLICDKYHELSSKNISINQGNTLSAPSFKIPKPQTNLIERNDKVERLHDLVSKNDFTNLYGFGGSGKTSLVYLYLGKYRTEYNQIAYVVVNNNIKADFVSQINDTIHIFKPTDDKATQDKGFRNIKDIIKDTDNNRGKVDRYKSVIDYLEVNYKSDKPNLFIIDINNADDADKFGEDLLNNTLSSNKIYPEGWKYLIVSRGNIYKGLAQLNLNEKEQDIAHTDFLKNLFLKYVGDKYNDFSDGDFAELFKTIYYSPLMAEQLGIYLKGTPQKSVSQIKEILHKTNFKNEKRSGITSQNRSSEEEKTIIGFLKNIIVFDKLSVGEQILLKHFVLWPTEYIPKEVIWQLLSKTFESEKNRFTKLWSIVKRYCTSFGYQQRIGVFFNRTKRYAVSKLWFYILFILLLGLSFFTSLLNLIVKSSFFGICGMLMYLLLEIALNSCTFRSPFRNCARIAFGASIGLLIGLISLHTTLSKYLVLIFANLGAPFIISLFPFLKKIIKCLFSKSYTNIDQDSFDSLLSDLSKRGVISENEDGHEKCYKLHGLIAESIRTQIDIPNTDYSDYIDSIKRIAKYDNKDFEPFATCIGQSLGIYKIVVDGITLFTIAYKSYDNASTAKYAAQLYQGIINHRSFNIYKPEKYLIASAYKGLAILQQNLLEDYDSAKSNYEKAIEISEQLPIDNPEYQNDLANTYNNLAYLQLNHLGEYELSKSNYEKAIAIQEQLPKDNPEYQNGLARAYYNLAYLQQYHLGEYELSKSNYEKAIEIGEQLPKDNPEYQDDLAGSYNNLAILQQYHLENYDSAKSNYEKAIAIYEQLPKDNPEYQNYLAWAYNNLADLQNYNLGDYDTAQTNYENAIKIGEQLPKDNPEYQDDLARSYNNLAYLQQDHLGEYELSKSNYEKAIAIREQLPKDNPEYQNGLARAYNNLANLQQYHWGDYDSAKVNYEKAIAICEQLPKDNPEYQHGVARAYNELAYTYDKLKEYDKAIESINTAIDIAFQLKETESKYLIYWLGYRHSLAEIKFNNGKDLDEVKNILAEIKPLAQQCLKDNPDDEWTKTVNNSIADLLSKINN